MENHTKFTVAGGNVFWMLDASIMPNSALGQTTTGAMQR
jgi:hypothetical protein